MSAGSQAKESDRLTFPAMLPAEIAVFRAWLAKHQTEYDSFEYNVRVGPGFDPGPALSDSVRQGAILSTRKRIDALGHQGGNVTIIEVKERVTPAAMGQLLSYRVHWMNDNPNTAMPKILLVANRLADGMDVVLRAHNVPYELVEV